MKKFAWIICFLLFGWPVTQVAGQPANSHRAQWLAYMDKIARPVFSNLAKGELKKNMPVALSKEVDNAANRKEVSYLEAFGRTLCGIGPWLHAEGGSEAEIKLRNEYRAWAIKAVDYATNPASPDYLKWNGGQPLVDASFFALGLIRCPWLWEQLNATVKQQVVNALLITRPTVPVYSNWILFSAMIEAFFCRYDLPYDPVRIEYGIREFSEHWYTGDGLFSDGMNFAQDYYNSYVIQPYLTTILQVMGKKKNAYQGFAGKFRKISARYADIQERLIAADGSFPVTGRSICYRAGAFQHLADQALQQTLPAHLAPPQVRSALTAVLHKTLDNPANFQQQGWLQPGLSGYQPGLAERYITTGSLYLCMAVFLPLGLPETNEFWAGEAQPWTAVKAWSGQDLPADHALDIH